MTAVARTSTEVIVRAHSPVETEGDSVPAAWSLERWDVRPWCKDSNTFSKLAGSLLRADAPSYGTRVTPVLKRLPPSDAQSAQRALPVPSLPVCPPIFDDQFEEDRVHSNSAEAEAYIFSELAARMMRGEEDGADMFTLARNHAVGMDVSQYATGIL